MSAAASSSSHSTTPRFATSPTFQWICWPGGSGWLLHENEGSFDGWFHWLPKRYRVGPWHPTAIAFLVAFYASVFVLRPPLEFPVSAVPAYSEWWWADVIMFAYSLFVSWVSWERLGGVWPYVVSYTGWSWVILTTRAGCTAAGAVLGSTALARIGSALRAPAIVGATITFVLWNAVLFPLIFAVAPREPKPGKTRSKFGDRRTFLRFNFSFFMVNVHVLNLPLAGLNVLYGGGVRLLGLADLWVTFVVLALYTSVYMGGLDRAGLHFYPMFTPRSPACVVAYSALFAMYYGIWRACNARIAS